MNKGFLVGCLVAVSALLALAVVAQVVPPDIQKYPSCKYCGMDRQKFASSRMLIEYEDGSGFGSCSIHCLAVDLAQSIDKTPKVIQVADFNSKNLLEAEKAHWVIGGRKPGVMTKQAKWAFEKDKDAQAFIKENEGKPASFDEAMKATYEDMYADTKMIRDRRAKKRLLEKEKK
jgi:copper chaperone NosL